MEQELSLDLPKKFMECNDNINEYVKVVQECVEVILEECKNSGSQKLINGAQGVYDDAMEALIPSNKETAENYVKAAEELSNLLVALNG